MVSYHFNKIILKDPLEAWKDHESGELLEGLCGHPLASSFSCEKIQIIDFTDI